MSTQIPKRGDSRRDEVIAGEYVLGVLSADDRRRVEARIVLDSNFAAMVNRWQTNLSSLDAVYEPARPSLRMSSPIERRFPEAPVAIRTGDQASGLWNSLAFWRVLTTLAVGGLAAVAFIESGKVASPVASIPLLAELSSDDNAMALVARYDATGQKLVLTPVAAAQDTPRSLEVWMIEEGNAPESLGILPQTGEGEIAVPPEFATRMKTGVTLAVSVEPAGGSTGGASPGAIIASGKTRLP